MTYGRVMMIGAGGAGKTSLRHGLMKKSLPEMAFSTLLANSLSVKCQWARTGDPSGQTWVEVDDEDELNELAYLLSTTLQNKSLLKSVECASAIKAFQPFSHPLTKGSVLYNWITRYLSEFSEKILHFFGEPIQHYEGSEAVEKIMDKVFKKTHLAKEHCQPQSDVLLNLWDSGGQVVFMNVLPAFLTKRTLFMLVFDASKNLDARVQVHTVHAGEIIHTNDFHLNTFELLLQWMSAIHVHFSLRKTGSKGDPYPRIILVGTHLDRLVSRGCNPGAETERILDSLRSQYKDKMYADLLMPSPGYVVDNTTAGEDKEDPAFEKIRKCIHEFTTTNLPVRTPITWVLFRKVMQTISRENKPVLRYSEVISIAKSCSIPLGAVPSLLNFYHELGVFFYYSMIPSLKEVIIADPQWLINYIAKLLSPHGFEDQGRERLWNLFRTKGILVEELYKEVLTHTIISPQGLVDLLEHFLLAVQLVKPTEIHPYEGREYFIPVMLDVPSSNSCETKLHSPNYCEQESTYSLLSTNFASCSPSDTCPPVPSLPETKHTFDSNLYVHTTEPIHLVFHTHYTPPGFYVRLLASITRHSDSRILFQLISHNSVTFAYKEVDEITVREHTDSIEVQVTRAAPGGPHVPPFHQACRDILELINTSIQEVYIWLPGVLVSTSFLCSKCSSKQPRHFVNFDHNTLTTTTVRCQREILQQLGKSPSRQYWLKLQATMSSESSMSGYTAEKHYIIMLWLIVVSLHY